MQKRKPAASSHYLNQGNQVPQDQLSRDNVCANLRRGAMFPLASIVFAGNLLDERNNGTAQLAVLDANIRFHQRKSI